MVRIAISMGDPSGIGPEIIVKALQRIDPDVSYLVYGDRGALLRAAAAAGLPLPTRQVQWIETSTADAARLRWGVADVVAGELQVKALAGALDAVLAGHADALCTAPITKAAAHAAGFAFPGHTEYLGARCRTTRFVMMLAGPTLRVVPLTGHIALRDVPAALTEEKIVDAILVTATGLKRDFAVESPRLAVAALNPHAGEAGLMGDEEQRLITPALRRAAVELERAEVAAEIVGPIPADGLFAHHRDYDAVLCCYHDQALIPLKMVHRDDGVNITLGLPIVRTSPAHGSALDIAGRGVARPESMVAALRLAAEVARRRQSFSGIW
jgi:4-hydroxythreonine-4-phosphate dehydrogenase